MEAGRLEEDDRYGDNARARTLVVHTMEAIIKGPFQSSMERLTVYPELPPLLVSGDSCDSHRFFRMFYDFMSLEAFFLSDVSYASRCVILIAFGGFPS